MSNGKEKLYRVFYYALVDGYYMRSAVQGVLASSLEDAIKRVRNSLNEERAVSSITIEGVVLDHRADSVKKKI